MVTTVGGFFNKRTPCGKKTRTYNTWVDMLQRCYSERWKSKNETYKDVWLCEEWHDFQVFAKWFRDNDREGYQLDKDILSIYFQEGIYYSPKTCRMLPKDLNLLLTNRVGKCRNSELPLGVCHNKSRLKPFTSYCNNGHGKTVNLGAYETAERAFYAYKVYKEGLIQSKAKHYYEQGVIDECLYEALMSYEVEPEPEI